MHRTRHATSALAVTVAMTVSLTAAPVAPAQAESVIANACPTDFGFDADHYTDVPASGTFTRSINCAVWWGMLDGSGAYNGSANSNRAHIASMLAPLIRAAGVAPASVPSAGFSDTVGHPYVDDIDLLAHFDVTEGTSPTTFSPSGNVTRGEFAALAARMHQQVFSRQLPSGSGEFTDVSSSGIFADAISRLVGSGITTGVTASRFEPGGNVTRGQIAAFAVRYANVLVRQGLLDTPATPPATGGTGSGGAGVPDFDVSSADPFNSSNLTTVGTGSVADWCSPLTDNVFGGQIHFNMDTLKKPTANFDGCVWVHGFAPAVPGVVRGTSPTDGVRFAAYRGAHSSYSVPANADLVYAGGDPVLGEVRFYTVEAAPNYALAVVQGPSHTWYGYLAAPADYVYSVDSSDAFNAVFRVMDAAGVPGLPVWG